MANEKPVVGLTKDDLKDVLTAVVQEARKPPEPTEAELAEIQQAKEMRAMQAQLEHEKAENRRREQELCSHIRRDGSTLGVFIQASEGGNYILCQACQKIIRPETDGPLFNRLIQLLTPAIF